MLKKLESTYGTKTQFFFFTFTPLFLSFLLPLIFFKFPLNAVNHNLLLPNHIVYKAMLMDLGWFILLGCCLVLPQLGVTSKIRVWPEKYLLPIMVFFTFVSLSYHIIAIIVEIPISLNQFVLPLSFLPVFTIVIGMYLRKLDPSCSKWFIFPLYAINALVIYLIPLLHANCYQTVYSLIALAFAYTIITKNKLKSTLFIIFCLLVITSSMLIKNYIRESALGKFYMLKHPELAIQGDIAGFQPKNQLFFSNKGYLKYPNYVIRKVVIRLDHLSEFSYVLTQTPGRIPFVYGETYKGMLTMFIPRAIWHNKPTIEVGHFYGHRYHFIGDDDHVTNWAATLPTESWINFGWAGFILSAIIIGLLMNFLWSFFVGQPIAIGNLILATALVYNASQGEIITTIYIGTLIPLIIFYWIIDVLIRKFLGRQNG